MSEFFVNVETPKVLVQDGGSFRQQMAAPVYEVNPGWWHNWRQIEAHGREQARVFGEALKTALIKGQEFTVDGKPLYPRAYDVMLKEGCLDIVAGTSNTSGVKSSAKLWAEHHIDVPYESPPAKIPEDFERLKQFEAAEKTPGTIQQPLADAGFVMGVEAETVEWPSDGTAPAYLNEAVRALLDRAASRDAEDGERSMLRTVNAFNEIYGTILSETQGWQFMALLKIVRGSQGEFRSDDFIDEAAYAALAGEAANKEGGTDGNEE